MTRRCLSPEQRDITIPRSRFPVGILKALFRNILQYLQPPQTLPLANMFAGIFVKSKHDGMVGESVQSLTKLRKTQQLMNTCGKSLTVFPQLRMLIRKGYKAKTLLLPISVLQNWKPLPWLLLSCSSPLHLLDPGTVFKIFSVWIKWVRLRKTGQRPRNSFHVSSLMANSFLLSLTRKKKDLQQIWMYM